MRSAGRIAALVLGLQLTASAEIFSSEEGGSRFERTVVAVEAAPAAMQVQFARIALSELYQIYLAEADLARHEASQLEDDAKLTNWAAAVDQFASQLLLVIEDVATGFPLSISITTPGVVGLIIAGRQILLTHPRADQQRAYEQQVLTEFCSREKCTQLTAEADTLEAIPLSTPTVNPLWSFTRDEAVCYSDEDGVRVKYHSTRKLARLRAHCNQLFHEIRSLRAELRWQKYHGVEPDWQSLELQPTPGRPEHLLTLNQQGDSALLSLPLLKASPGLLPLLTPWLEAELENVQQPPLLIDAKRFGWGLDSP
jgi:hypothetical protein